MPGFIFQNHDLLNEAADYWNKGLKKARTRGFLLAILMLVVGVLCLSAPIKSAYVMEVFASIVILLSGIQEIVSYFHMPPYLRFGGGLFSGILNILLGLMLLTSPADDVLDVFGFLFALELLAVGIQQLAVARRLRYFQAADDTGWLTADGVINIIAAVLFLFLPYSSAAALSIFVGIYLLSTGICILIASFRAKELKIHNDQNVIDEDQTDL